MKSYSAEFKHALVKKALSHPDISPRRFAKEAGVSSSGIYKWINEYKKSAGEADIKSNNPSNTWTKEEKFTMLLETESLSEEQQGAYCRRKGIFQYQLSEWKKEFMSSKLEDRKSKEHVGLKKLRQENKTLKKELRRKEKALAEASALLILKKKADLLWGESEED